MRALKNLYGSAKIKDMELKPLCEKNKEKFKREMSEAFQAGTEAVLGKQRERILPEAEIERALRAENAFAYVAESDGETVGGAIITSDPAKKRNSLDLFFVAGSRQGTGIGQKIWSMLEQLYPDTEVWETVTPYFEKRNIHFYINCCGFSAVEFFNPRHRDPEKPVEGVGKDCFFRFEKRMPKKEPK